MTLAFRFAGGRPKITVISANAHLISQKGSKMTDNMPHLVKKTCHFLSPAEARPMRIDNMHKFDKNEKGFSIVELLVVCVVIAIVATLAVPHLQKALRAAENGNTFATLRVASSTELSYYSQHGRFARVTEVNNVMAGALGTNSGNDVNRGRFVFSMSPATPTDGELREGFTITATRDVAGEGSTYVYQLTQSGEITQVLP